MNYTEKGTGQPIVFLHGFCESKELWEDFSEPFSKNHRVIYFDLPGFGNSPLEKDDISLEEVAELIQKQLKKLNVDKPIVIGHSLGGYITLALAEQMGAELKAIGLFHSSAFADGEEKIKSRNKVIDFVEKNGVKKFTESLIPDLFADKNKDQCKSQIDFALEMGRKTSKNGLIAFTKAMRDRKERMDVLENFPGKKLMIAGKLDNAIPIDISRKHKKVVDNYHELDEAGHMGMFEQKQKTQEIIQDFLNGLEEKG